jgi:hypothetical protein
MNLRTQRRLLDPVLTGADVEDLRRASLEQGVAVLRWRSRRRRLARVCLLIALPAWVGVAVWFWQFHLFSDSLNSRNRSVAMASIKPPPSRVSFITDEELFTLFHGRSLALIGPPGHQELVFLDQWSAHRNSEAPGSPPGS